jgi:hypothetical protein
MSQSPVPLKNWYTLSRSLTVIVCDRCLGKPATRAALILERGKTDRKLRVFHKRIFNDKMDLCDQCCQELQTALIMFRAAFLKEGD